VLSTLALHLERATPRKGLCGAAMWRLLLLYVAAVSAAAPPPSPPPYNTPPGMAPVVLSSEGLGMSTDALGQGISNLNLSSIGVSNGMVCVCALSHASHALMRARNCEKTTRLAVVSTQPSPSLSARNAPGLRHGVPHLQRVLHPVLKQAGVKPDLHPGHVVVLRLSQLSLLQRRHRRRVRVEQKRREAYHWVAATERHAVQSGLGRLAAAAQSTPFWTGGGCTDPDHVSDA
jgi:hypothetical protein